MPRVRAAVNRLNRNWNCVASETAANSFCPTPDNISVSAQDDNDSMSCWKAIGKANLNTWPRNSRSGMMVRTIVSIGIQARFRRRANENVGICSRPALSRRWAEYWARFYSESFHTRYSAPCPPSIHRSASVILRITWHGLPTATEWDGISLVTTEPAPITTSSPMVTPGQTTTLPPNHTSLPMVIGRRLPDRKRVRPHRLDGMACTGRRAGRRRHGRRW